MRVKSVISFQELTLDQKSTKMNMEAGFSILTGRIDY